MKPTREACPSLPFRLRIEATSRNQPNKRGTHSTPWSLPSRKYCRRGLGKAEPSRTPSNTKLAWRDTEAAVDGTDTGATPWRRLKVAQAPAVDPSNLSDLSRCSDASKLAHGEHQHPSQKQQTSQKKQTPSTRETAQSPPPPLGVGTATGATYRHPRFPFYVPRAAQASASIATEQHIAPCPRPPMIITPALRCHRCPEWR